MSVKISSLNTASTIDSGDDITIAGNNPLYFSDWGGGWFMQDSVWIRSYNNKSLWMNAGLIGGDGGLTIGYGGVTPPSGGAIIGGLVGIGTTTPYYKTTIYNATTDTDVLCLSNPQVDVDNAKHFVGLTFQDQNANGSGNASAIRSYSNLYNDWGSRLTFSTTSNAGVGVVERVRINEVGNVLIGTTTDAGYKLDVNGSAKVNLNLTVSGLLTLNLAESGTNTYHTLYRNAITTENMFRWITAGVARWWVGQRSKNSEDGFSIYSAAINDDVLYFSTAGNATFYGSVTTGYTIGINGTLNSVYGSVAIDHPGVQTWRIGITNLNTSTFSIGNDIGGLFATKVLNITQSGNVLIGTTTNAGYRLDVNGDARVVALRGTSASFAGTVNFAEGYGLNGFSDGTGDGANFTIYNFKLTGWSSMAFYNPTSGGTYPYQVSGLINFREGTIDMKGGFFVNGVVVLNASNYNTYAPTLTGTGASGTWGISITGNAYYSTYAGTSSSLVSMLISQFTNDSGYVTSGALAAYLPLAGGTMTGNIIYDPGDATNWYIRGAANGATIRLKYSGGSTNRSGALGWVDNANTYYDSLTWTDGSVNSNVALQQNGYQVLHANNFNTYAVASYYGYDVPMGQTGDWIGMTQSSGISGWTHVINMAWQSTTQGSWISQIAFAAQTGTGAYYRTTSGGITGASWIRLIDASNIGSQSVSSASSANAVYLGGNTNYTITDNSWAGTAGYHGYSYTGGNYRFGFSSTGGYIDVYTDGNFYAGIDLNGLNNLVLHTGNYTSYAATVGHTHGLGRYSLQSGYIDGLTNSNFRGTLFGLTDYSYNISTARWNTTPAILSGLSDYGTMMAWSGSDTQGFIAIDYYSANAKIGGGNGNNINWTALLIHSANIGSYLAGYLPLTGGTLTGTLIGTTIRARKSQADADYTTAAIWTESFSTTTTGIAFHINAVVGKFLEMRTNGILYWDNSVVITSNRLTLNYDAAPISADSVTQNQLGYVNGNISLFGQSDGGLYSSAYSSSWIHQIFGDFRTGQIAVRGKSSNTWGAWRIVLDSVNYATYLSGAYLPLTGGTITGDLTVNNKVYVGTHGCYFEEVLIGSTYELRVVDSAGNMTIIS
jgi:hypothetical protein